jgi:hypothetical protein
VRWSLVNFLPQLLWNFNLPDLSLPHSLGWQAHATTPSYWLRWGSRKLLVWQAASTDPPDLSLPSP